MAKKQNIQQLVEDFNEGTDIGDEVDVKVDSGETLPSPANEAGEAKEKS